MADAAGQECYAITQLCRCDMCDEDVPLLHMTQWEWKGWEEGVSWCRFAPPLSMCDLVSLHIAPPYSTIPRVFKDNLATVSSDRFSRTLVP